MSKKVLSVLLSVIILLGVFSVVPIASIAKEIDISEVSGDDYPYSGTSAGVYIVDDWNFYRGECTSFCAWRLNHNNGIAFHNWMGGIRWGNANTWDDAARNLGYTVNNTPAVGSIAYWEGTSGSTGHVAWVSSVYSSTVDIEEYNYGWVVINGEYHGNHRYNSRNISITNPSGYIHIKDINTSPSVTFNDWWSDNYTYIGSTDAAIGQEIIVSGSNYTQLGMILYNSSGTRLASATGAPTSGVNRYYFKINEEMSYTLSPDTDYQYRFFAVVGGQTYYSSYKSFRTSAITFKDWWNDRYTYIGTTDASIGQELTASGNGCTEIGMVLYDSVSERLASAYGGWTPGYSRYYFKINEELHYTLTPGTTYKYRFYAVVNGQTYYSEMKSFATIPDAEVDMSWTELYSLPSKDSAYVSVKATAPSSGTFSSAAIKVWDEKGSLIASKTEDPFAATRANMTLFYDIYAECGVLLQPATGYQYQVSVTYNGHSYDSPRYSFRTENQDERYFGIDVSSHQGQIDWEEVSKHIDFAIIRCGYGSDYTLNDDSFWAYNAAECERLHIPYGVYLYSYAENEDEAKSEAEHVIRLLEGYHPTLPVYYDLEDNNTVGNLSAYQIAKQTKAFCKLIQNAGYTPGVYANLSWWNSKLTDTLFDDYQKWIAVYESASPMTEQGWELWQYSSSGRVTGINGAVDTNYSKNLIPEANQCVLGDVDSSGKTDIVDATIIQRYATNLKLSIPEEQIAARGDVDGSGKTDITDATFIQRYATGIPTPFPIGE